eukprot:scaffold127845_cov84-Attheya_sp.AAC.3
MTPENLESATASTKNTTTCSTPHIPPHTITKKQHETRIINTSTMRHEDMCYSDACIYCHPDRQPYKVAEEIQKSFMRGVYSAEGEKECTEVWETPPPTSYATYAKPQQRL